MKKYVLLYAFALFAGVACPQDGTGEKKDRQVSFGVKGGFNSSMYFVDKFKIRDITINEIQNNYKVGYFATFLVRFNMKRHFLQPELGYNVSRSEIVFDKTGLQSPNKNPEYASIDATIHTVDLPLFYGYKFIQSGPYEMYFFIGPKIKYVWAHKSKLEFGNFGESTIEEQLHPFNIGAILGVGVRISHVLFDFRYDIGLHNISKSVSYANINNEEVEEKSDIVLRRRNNILSFSLGFIF